MLKKSLICIAFALAIVAVGSSQVFAQSQLIKGVVKIKKADGTETPLANALVEAYRTDAKTGKLPEARTNEMGEFSFTSAQNGHNYTLTASAEGAAAKISPNIKAGMETVVITLDEGQGDRLNEVDIREIAAAIRPDGTLDQEKLKQSDAERQKQIEAYNAEKSRIENATKIVGAALKDGNDAFNKQQYDVAIAKYTEGYNAQPDFAGSSVVMLTNRGMAHHRRAVDQYNASVKMTNATERFQTQQSVKKDFADALESYSLAWKLLNSASGKEAVATLVNENKPKILNGSVEVVSLMVRTSQADIEKMGIAKEMVEAYMAEEKNKDKREAAVLSLADAYKAAQDFPGAVAEYRKLLVTSPTNYDAMVGLASSLIFQAYVMEEGGNAAGGKEAYQEAANILQDYMGKAPSSHGARAEAEAHLESLKEMKITPRRR